MTTPRATQAAAVARMTTATAGMESAGQARAGDRRPGRRVGRRELISLGQIGIEVDGDTTPPVSSTRHSRPAYRRIVRPPTGWPARPGSARCRPGSGMTRARRGAIVSTMPQPPALTPEQRQAALAKAAKVRRERAEVKEKLKLGSITLSELLTTADSNETVGKMKVLSVLESLPGLGKVKARRLMDTVGISESRRLQGLGQQPARVAAARDRSLSRTPAESARLVEPTR